MAANSHTTRRSHRIWPWIALGAAALAVAFVLSSSPVKAALDVAVSGAHGLIEEHPVTGALVFFLLLWGGWVSGAAMAYAPRHAAGASVSPQFASR